MYITGPGHGGPGVVATSALGGIAYLADFSIGANIGISYGTVNAILGILVAAVVIFVFFLIAAPTFRSPESFSNVLYSSSVIGLR